MESAPHAQQRIYVKLTEMPEVFDILRRGEWSERVDKRVKWGERKERSPLYDFQEKEYGVFEERSFRYGIHRAADGEIFSNLSLGQCSWPFKTVAAADHLVFLLGRVLSGYNGEDRKCCPFWNNHPQHQRVDFQWYREADLVAFPVCADGFIERNFWNVSCGHGTSWEVHCQCTVQHK